MSTASKIWLLSLVLASTAQALHLVDRLGYVHDAIAEAEALGGATGAEVVLFHRTGYPAHSLYAITPTPAPLNEAIPFSYPGPDRSKLPRLLRSPMYMVWGSPLQFATPSLDDLHAGLRCHCE